MFQVPLNLNKTQELSQFIPLILNISYANTKNPLGPLFKSNMITQWPPLIAV